MSLASFAITTALLLLLYIILNLLYIGCTATLASVLRLHVREVALFTGPRLVCFHLGDTLCSVRLFPLGSFVQVAPPGSEDLPPEDAWDAIAPWLRIPLHAAGPVGLLAVAGLLVGPRATWSAFSACYSLPYSLATAALRPSAIAPLILATFATTSTAHFLGLASACMAALNLFPIPLLAGGMIIIDAIDAVVPVPIRLREQLLQFGFVTLLLLLFQFLFFYFMHGVGRPPGAA